MVDAEMVAKVRRFNRAVTQRVGALEDRYLARDRPLGEARLLWEIGREGAAGCDVRRLRSRLDLDSGYVSRLLRRLEDDGLVSVGPSGHDGRVRTATLTRKGRAEQAVLDRRADALAQSFLAPLTDAQRTRLLASMEQVESLLSAALVDIRVVDPFGAEAQECLRRYFGELAVRFADGYDPETSLYSGMESFREPEGLFLVASLRDEPVGCGALKLHPGKPRRPPEIKRMWIDPSVRGIGLGRRMLGALEEQASAHGARTVRLETNRALAEAIAMYRSSGYTEIAPYNDEPYAHHWFSKPLPRAR